MIAIVQKRVESIYSREKIADTVKAQNQLRNNLIGIYLHDGNHGLIFKEANKPREIEDGEVPVLYSAGGMVPSIYLYGQSRPVHEHWQHYAVKNTGGIVKGDTTTLTSNANVEYGNVVLENPLDNGSNTNRIFSPVDYIRILISHGNLVNNESRNPGHATLAEIVAQYAKGGPNIMFQQKGTISENDPELYEKETRLFDRFVYDKSCLVSSLDEALDLINHDSGKTLKRLIHDANQQHSEYLTKLGDASGKKSRPKMFIGGSINEAIAKEAASYHAEFDFILARDIVNPEEDPIRYLRLMDNCDLVLILHSYAINNTNNHLLPIAESGYAVMNGKKVLYISDIWSVMDEIEKKYPQVLDRNRTVIDVSEKGIKDRFNRMREIGLPGHPGRHQRMRYLADFNEMAPLTDSYKLEEFGRAMDDAKWHMNHLQARYKLRDGGAKQ